MRARDRDPHGVDRQENVAEQRLARLRGTRLKITGLRARAVDVPMRRPLEVSAGKVSSAPLVLVDLFTDEGVTGCAYLFVYAGFALGPVAQLIANLEEQVRGEPLAPLALEEKLQKRFRLIGGQGFTLMALAGIDMAAWDALAKVRGVPLAGLLGAPLRSVPAYNSCGLGIIGAERAAAEARELLAEGGYAAVKVRLGYPRAETDLAVVRAVREAVGPDATLVADYNQALSVAEAIRRIRMLDAEGLLWVEEPVRADDVTGHAEVRRATKTAVQTGENWWGPHEMARFLRARACDYAMPDAMKIGGVTGWLRAAALAQVEGVPMSSHLFPEISVHLLAATPTAHFLEYVDWAAPILQTPLAIEGGAAVARAEAGCGIAWDEAAVAKYAV